MSLLVKTHSLLFVCLGVFIAVSTAGISDDDIGFFNRKATEPSLTPQFESLAKTTHLFRLSPTLETLTLNQWISEHRKKSVILIIDPLQPASFAQIAPFEKLVDSVAQNDLRCCIVFLHRRAEAYLDYITNLRSVNYDRFTAPIVDFHCIEQQLRKPIIVYMDTNQTILDYQCQYCNYDCLKSICVENSTTSLSVKGDYE